jgi:hypothetical protein
MSEMVEVYIDSIRVSLMSPQRVVVLRERNAERYLPIWVGPYEADAITVALQGIEVIRPLTQDLLKNVITLFGGTILRVEVVALREDIFYGNVVVERDGKIYDIDARPSDAIALAVRAHVPILVHRSVLDEAGIVPEKDIQEESSSQPQAPLQKPPVPTASGEDDETGRLDVFEDFLKKLSGDDNSSDSSAS